MGGLNIVDIAFKMLSFAMVVAIAVVLVSGGHNSGRPVQTLPESLCETRLRAIRCELGSFHALHGRYPASLSNIGSTGCPPVDARCPSSDMAYIYDPKQFPGHLVICPNPAHRDY